jgi:Holliday junction resolvase RusA-like endonuclease
MKPWSTEDLVKHVKRTVPLKPGMVVRASPAGVTVIKPGTAVALPAGASIDVLPLAVTIPGTPIGKGRPLSSLMKDKQGKQFIHHRTPEKTRRWEDTAAAHMRVRWGQPKFSGAMELEVIALFPRPQRLMRASDPNERVPHLAKPDADNIAKAVCDALQNSGAVTDDAIIVRLTVTKFYADREEQPYVLVILRQFQSPAVSRRPS